MKMNYELYQGDCLDILPTLEAGSIDAVIADPPYGTTACKWDSVIPLGPMWAELKRVIKPRGAIVLFASQPFTSVLVTSNLKQFRHEWIWNKSKGANFGSVKYEPLKIHESVLVFADGAVRINHQLEESVQVPVGRDSRDKGSANYFASFGNSFRRGVGYPRSIQKFPIPNNWTGGGLHPTQKPVDLLRYLVRTYTNVGDTVLDFCFGSNTTGVACQMEGRNFVGIEKDANYFPLGARRIEQVHPALVEVMA
jgi:site-specific DNA-methyltransferase (adenine-specific)